MELNDVYEVTEIKVGAKKSFGFQTYESERTLRISAKATPDQINLIVAMNQALCRKDVTKQLDIDKRVR